VSESLNHDCLPHGQPDRSGGAAYRNRDVILFIVSGGDADAVDSQTPSFGLLSLLPDIILPSLRVHSRRRSSDERLCELMTVLGIVLEFEQKVG
jgi:hypothetical protein